MGPNDDPKRRRGCMTDSTLPPPPAPDTLPALPMLDPTEPDESDELGRDDEYVDHWDQDECDDFYAEKFGR
jgi:hypothetical protein